MATPNMIPAGANDLKKKIIAASLVPIPAKVIGNTPIKILSGSLAAVSIKGIFIPNALKKSNACTTERNQFIDEKLAAIAAYLGQEDKIFVPSITKFALSNSGLLFSLRSFLKSHSP